MPKSFSPVRTLLLATIFLALSGLGLEAQTVPGKWTVTPLTGRVRAFLVNSSSVWAGTDTGVWSTTDNGTTWTQINTGLTTTSVKALASSGSVYYAGTNGGGVFKSTDGTNWTAFNAGLTNFSVTCLTFVGSDLYAGTYGSGVFLLKDTTWTAVNTGISPSAQIFALAASGTDLIAAGTLIFNDNHHTFKTSDKGATWKALGANSTDPAISPPALTTSIAVKGSTFIAASINGLYRTTDSGTNWTRLNSFQQIALSAIYSSDGSTLYASGQGQDGTLFGVSASSDNGTTWRAMSYGLEGGSNLAISGTTLFAGTSVTAGAATASATPVNASSTSATNYVQVYGHAPGSIASIFGAGLATTTAPASFVPLPTTLGGTTVSILDSAGNTTPAPLFYVSPGQINYQVPAGIPAGWIHLTITSGNGTVSYATAHVTSGAFGLFTADSTGSGPPAAYVQKVRADGSQQILPVAQFDAGQNKWVPVPIDMSTATDRIFLVLYGSGIRSWNTAVYPIVCYFTPTGGNSTPVLADFTGAHGTFVGVDQVNVLIPRSLAGSGAGTLYLTANTGPFSNSVNVNIQ